MPPILARRSRAGAMVTAEEWFVAHFMKKRAIPDAFEALASWSSDQPPSARSLTSAPALSSSRAASTFRNEIEYHLHHVCRPAGEACMHARGGHEMMQVVLDL